MGVWVNFMAHKTKINGTTYDINGGSCKVNGTKYNINKGRTKINGTGYDITFGPKLAKITASGRGDLSDAFIQIIDENGDAQKIIDEGTYYAIIGSEVYCHVYHRQNSGILLNGDRVDDRNYIFEINGDIAVDFVYSSYHSIIQIFDA